MKSVSVCEDGLLSLMRILLSFLSLFSFSLTLILIAKKCIESAKFFIELLVSFPFYGSVSWYIFYFYIILVTDLFIIMWKYSCSLENFVLISSFSDIFMINILCPFALFFFKKCIYPLYIPLSVSPPPPVHPHKDPTPIPPFPSLRRVRPLLGINLHYFSTNFTTPHTRSLQS